MEAVGGHNALLGIHNQVARKEWRVVTEGSARDRLAGDGPVDHGRVNGPSRIRHLHSESMRNGRMFRSSASSGSSSDSDHQNSDGKHNMIVSHEVLHQSGEDMKIYDEEPIQNGHSSSASNGLPLDFGGLNISKHETLEQRLHDVIRQREQIQRVEAELRAQFIARSEIIRMQNNFEEQTKQHSSVVSSLQEQLRDRDLRLQELEQKLEEKERQLHVNQKEASEAVNQVWAKDGLLREQTTELTSLRRERDTLLADQKATIAQFESDRAQLLSRLQDLEEQLQEKDRLLQEADEQHRGVQETIAFKEEQLREAQAWVQRAQELDAFYANTHNSLHAELRDRNEQLNQLWLGQQRQLAEVERYHSQTIQRLRMEVAEVREQNRVLKSSCQSNLDSKSDQCLQVSGGDKESLSPADASVKLRKGMATSSNQVEHAGVLPVPASPIIGPTAPVLAGNPIPVLHHFQGQAQGIMPTIPTAPSQINQSNFSNPVVIPAQQHLPMLHHQVLQSKLIQQPQLSQRFTHPQALPGYSHFPETKSPVSVQARAVHPQHQPIEQQSRDQVIIEQGRLNGLDMPHLPSVSASQHSVNMQNSSEPPLGKHQDSNPFIEKQASQMGEEVHVNDVQIKDGFVKILVPEAKEEQFEHQDIPDRALEDKPSDKEVEHMEMYTQHPVLHAVDHSKPSPLRDTADPLLVVGSRVEEQPLISSHAPPVHSAPDQDSNGKQGTGVQSTPLSATTASMNQISTTEGNSKVSTHMLLDEKSLLACLVRAIPSEASARIRISTTLPNRLGKILAPLHWHDYKKVYGRLDDFISSHPKLFVIDGDFVHLREGAHAIISATTAVAKVAAAAAAPPSFGTTWPPTVAITPVAQSQFQRTRRTHPSTFFGAKDTSGSSGNNIKQDDLFSHIQMIGDHQSHQGSQHQQGSYPLNGIRNASGPFGSRQERVLCTGSSGEISGIPSPYGASSAQRKNDIIFGGRSNTVDAESFARKDYPGLSQTQENRVAHSS